MPSADDINNWTQRAKVPGPFLPIRSPLKGERLKLMTSFNYLVAVAQVVVLSWIAQIVAA